MNKTVLFTVIVAAQAACNSTEAKGGAKPEPEKAVAKKAPAKAEAPTKKAAPAALLDVSRWNKKAPDKFAVKFETTKGDIIIDVERAWSPKGADRFYNLVKAGYYNDVAFFRVIGGFMAQVGISGYPQANTVWREARIQDDPKGVKSNTRGFVSFATAGPNTRTTQFFINFGNNGRLDGMGFTPFGKVRDMSIVDKLYAGYGEGAPRGRGPNQMRMQTEGNDYLRKSFPKLDYIKSASVL